MKKRFLVLTMIACILGLTACGNTKQTTQANDFITSEEAITTAEALVDNINQVYLANAKEQYADYPVIFAAIESWEDAAEEFGNYQSVISSEITSFDDEEVVIQVTFQGDSVYKKNKMRTATEEIVLSAEGISSMSTSVNYDMSELMEKAALNTLLGMGTVFAVLILISLIIYCFTFIPKIQAAFSKKSKESVKEVAVNNTIAQIVEKEEASDDLELVAVISAAIAASEGQSSTDGFVVRSIIRR